MRRIALAGLLLLGGCAIFSTPGRVTSAEGTSEAGGVYMHVLQPASGVGCPSAIAFGAQTMGGIDATCSDGGKTQTIHATAPDPTPALTAAYVGVNQQMATIADILKTLIGLAQKAAPAPISYQPIQPMQAAPAPADIRQASYTTPMMVCPMGTLIGLINGKPVCQ